MKSHVRFFQTRAGKQECAQKKRVCEIGLAGLEPATNRLKA
jgi:hypothetical protein